MFTELPVRWDMNQHKRVAAEKEQQARHAALAEEARKERETTRLRYDR